MSLQLYVIGGPDKDRAFALREGADLMLGRGSQSAYQVTDPTVSRSHCQLLCEGEQVTAICKGGSGGTLINGKKITKQTLKPGDVLQVGATQLRFQLEDAAGATTIGGAQPVTEKAVPSGGVEQLEALKSKTIAHYEIGDGPIIGRGSTSIVFHATDTRDQRPVALKVLLPEISQDEDELQRFVRAMKTVMPLRHPHIITLYAAGKTGPYCWAAMEYVAGENLTQVIQRIGVAGMLDWRYAFRVALQIGQALAYAHGQKIIHRNVTPKNILMDATSKEAKLGDLMKAKAMEGILAKQITRPGELIGDVAYMSPERTRGATDVDGRADIYGLGATVYALLTGRPPFDGATLVEKITRIRKDDPVKPTKFQLSIPSAFEGAVLKMLAKRPEDRFQTADDVVAELERIGKFHGMK
jgi:pSer/pThr/pTyr-binding forkhead associated (FHA) protein